MSQSPPGFLAGMLPSTLRFDKCFPSLPATSPAKPRGQLTRRLAINFFELAVFACTRIAAIFSATSRICSTSNQRPCRVSGTVFSSTFSPSHRFAHPFQLTLVVLCQPILIQLSIVSSPCERTSFTISGIF